MNQPTKQAEAYESYFFSKRTIFFSHNKSTKYLQHNFLAKQTGNMWFYIQCNNMQNTFLLWFEGAIIGGLYGPPYSSHRVFCHYYLIMTWHASPNFTLSPCKFSVSHATLHSSSRTQKPETVKGTRRSTTMTGNNSHPPWKKKLNIYINC